MPRQFHNLDGFARDLRRALDAGDQRAYELAELLWEALDLVEAPEDVHDADQLPDGAGDGQDGLQHPGRSPGAGAPSQRAGSIQQVVDPGDAGVLRVPVGESPQVHLPLADPGRTGGGSAIGRASVLTDAEFRLEAKRRGVALGSEVRRGTTSPIE